MCCCAAVWKLNFLVPKCRDRDGSGILYCGGEARAAAIKIQRTARPFAIGLRIKIAVSGWELLRDGCVFGSKGKFGGFLRDRSNDAFCFVKPEIPD